MSMPPGMEYIAPGGHPYSPQCGCMSCCGKHPKPAKPMKSRAYSVIPLPNGGYAVEHECVEEFGCTTLDEALRYIRAQLLPQPDLNDELARILRNSDSTEPESKDGW